MWSSITASLLCSEPAGGAVAASPACLAALLTGSCRCETLLSRISMTSSQEEREDLLSRPHVQDRSSVFYLFFSPQSIAAASQPVTLLMSEQTPPSDALTEKPLEKPLEKPPAALLKHTDVRKKEGTNLFLLLFVSSSTVGHFMQRGNFGKGPHFEICCCDKMEI